MKSGRIKTKMSQVVFLSITISYPYNQLWVIGGPYLNYQAYMGWKHNCPKKKSTQTKQQWPIMQKKKWKNSAKNQRTLIWSKKVAWLCVFLLFSWLQDSKVLSASSSQTSKNRSTYLSLTDSHSNPTHPECIPSSKTTHSLCYFHYYFSCFSRLAKTPSFLSLPSASSHTASLIFLIACHPRLFSLKSSL